jgi:predicted O-methyltransferase YrrM
METESFESAWRTACECNVLLSPAEGKALFDRVTRAPEHVVEVGSYYGGSAVILAKAGARRLTLIEPVCRPELLLSLARSGLLHRVRLLSYADGQLWHLWTSPVSFLFLDHDHDYLSARNSLVAWRRHLVPGAQIAVHDYVAFPDVRKAADELAPELHLVEVVENLAFFTWVT